MEPDTPENLSCTDTEAAMDVTQPGTYTTETDKLCKEGIPSN